MWVMLIVNECSAVGLANGVCGGDDEIRVEGRPDVNSHACYAISRSRELNTTECGSVV